MFSWLHNKEEKINKYSHSDGWESLPFFFEYMVKVAWISQLPPPPHSPPPPPSLFLSALHATQRRSHSRPRCSDTLTTDFLECALWRPLFCRWTKCASVPSEHIRILLLVWRLTWPTCSHAHHSSCWLASPVPSWAFPPSCVSPTQSRCHSPLKG